MNEIMVVVDLELYKNKISMMSKGKKKKRDIYRIQRQ